MVEHSLRKGKVMGSSPIGPQTQHQNIRSVLAIRGVMSPSGVASVDIAEMPEGGFWLVSATY